MQAITPACWNFGSISNNDNDNDKDVAIKLENYHDDSDLTMGGTSGYDSDSDIEIISSNFITPARAPQNGGPDRARRTVPAAPERTQVGAKRRDSPTDLDGDESPTKKAKANGICGKGSMPDFPTTSASARPLSSQNRSFSPPARPNHIGSTSSRPFAPNGLPSKTTSMAQRPSVPSRVNRPTILSSLTRTPNLSNTKKLGGSLDHLMSSSSMQPCMRRLLSGPKEPKEPEADSDDPDNIIVAARPENHDQPSNSRLGFPFDEDDSDEDSEKPRTRHTALGPEPWSLVRKRAEMRHDDPETVAEAPRFTFTESRMALPSDGADSSEGLQRSRPNGMTPNTTTSVERKPIRSNGFDPMTRPQHHSESMHLPQSNKSSARGRENSADSASPYNNHDQPFHASQTSHRPIDGRQRSNALSGSNKQKNIQSHLDKIRQERSRPHSTLLISASLPAVRSMESSYGGPSITTSRNSSSAFPLFESDTRSPRAVPGLQFLKDVSNTVSRNKAFEKLHELRQRPDLFSDSSRGDSRFNTDEANEKQKRQENSRMKHAEMMANVKNTAPDQRLQGESSDDADSQTSTSTIPAAPSKESIVQRPVDPAVLAESRRKKEEAAEARRQADRRREDDACQRAQEQAEVERLEFEERKKALAAYRKAEKQRQKQVDDEAKIFSDRDKALSKLAQVKPTKPTGDIEPVDQSTRRSGSDSSNLNGLLATVSTIPQQTTSFEPAEKEKPATQTPDYGVHILQDASTQASSQTVSQGAPEPNSQQTNADRELRIQQMKERNERRRIADEEERQRRLAAEKEEEEEQRRVDEANRTSLLDSKPHPLPKGPVSLNSSAGRKLLAESKTKVQPFGEAPNNSHNRNPSHMRKLREILPEDIELVKWRDIGMDWGDIAQLINRKYQNQRAESTWRKRYKQIKDAVTAATLPEALKASLYNGCEDARREVNHKLNGDSPQASGKTVTLRPIEKDNETVAIDSRPSTHPSLPKSNKTQISTSPNPYFKSSSTLSGFPTPQPAQDLDEVAPRPTMGGKTMNEETFRYFLEVAMEVWVEKEDEDSRPSREPSPDVQDDYAPFTYQVQRRELCQEDLDDGNSIDDEPWVCCRDTFDTVREANLDAINEIFRDPSWGEPEVDLSGDFQQRREFDEHGMVFYELMGTHGGLRQIRVARFLRAARRGNMPHSKDGWAPRTIYFMKWREMNTPKLRPMPTKPSPAPQPQAQSEPEPELEDDPTIDALFEEAVEESTKCQAQDQDQGQGGGQEEAQNTRQPQYPEESHGREQAQAQEESYDDGTSQDKGQRQGQVQDRVEGHDELKHTCETDVENEAFTTLELANMAAVKMFVERTFVPKSGHLTVRNFEIQQEEARYLNDLDEDDFFDEVAEAVDGEGSFAVWVEEGKLTGPRNLD